MSRGVEIFTSLAEDYARYRPGYPPEVLSELRSVCGLRPDWLVADVGSGTGNLARLFLAAGHRVIGVEPNHRMRESAERMLVGYESFVSLDGTAESIPIATNSIDLVTVGQALHWFDVDKARVEFRRILRPGGWVAVLWNDPCYGESAFASEYSSIRSGFSGPSSVPSSAPPLDAGLDRFFAGIVRHEVCFSHTKRYDLEGLLGRARSSGNYPEPGTSGYAELTASLVDLFDRHQVAGSVELPYIARLYLGRL